MIDLIEALGDASADFHSALIVTYRVDLELYDGLVRRVLNKAGFTNQVVFCDFHAYIEAVTVQRPRYLGRQYSVVPVRQAGAFHPKAYLLLGATRGRALVGSGNTTTGGLLKNAEVFGQFEYHRERDAGPHPMFPQLANFMRQLGERASATTQRQIEQALRAAGWLELPAVSDGRHLLIGGPGRQPLLNQILQHLPDRRLDDALICSSSFDRRLAGLRRVAERVKRPPVCIVQPERTQVDGAEVRRLGKAADWRLFVDPYPKEKRRRQDVFAHAKLYVFRHGDTETAVFGSCNASEPALMGPNTECAVVLPPTKRGRIVERLGLKTSLKQSARDELLQKTWDDKTPEQDVIPYPLIAVAAAHGRFHLTLERSPLPQGARLALAAASHERPVAVLGLSVENGAVVSDTFEMTESLHVGWLISSKGTPLSNPVAITWPEVGHPRRAGGLGKKIERGLLGLHDGVVLGTILFELLDAFRDFEVIRAAGRQPAGPRSGDEAAESAEQRPAEFFYTDARPADDVDPRWTGDRLDLDILASLVQPLSTGARPVGDEEEDDDEFDESRLAEEAERRQIDKQQGKATGAERDQVPGVTSEKLERAIRRFERRLRRAAEAIERSLEYVDKLQSIPPQAVARQVWMAQIGAFLASRTVTSDDGDEFECVSAVAFAQYVIRISRALVGSLRGGFMSRLPDGLWETADGDVLRRGLGFLRTCLVWATALLVSEYGSAKPDDEIWPENLACAVPELVAARLVAKLDALGITADEDDLRRRFPAFADVPHRLLTEVRGKAERLARLVTSAERDGAAIEESGVSIPTPGMLVYNEKLGVTVIMNYAAPSYYWLADLSRPDDDPAKYRAHVRPLALDGVTPKIGCWYARAGVGVGA